MTADLVLAADPAVLEQAGNPGEYVVQACERAKAWLCKALESGDIDLIAELKSRAEAMHTYTRQKQLGKEAQHAAAEIVRRADRGLTQAVRRGQEDGHIKTRADGGWNARNLDGTGGTNKMSSGDYLGYGHTRSDMYALTDGVSDEEFDEALSQAKQEGNLARSNVVRKIRQQRAPAGPDDGEQAPEPGDRSSQAAARRVELVRRWAGEGSTSRQIAGLLGIRDDAVRRLAREHGISIRADDAVGRTRRLDSNRIVRETANAMEALATGAGLVSPAELDKAQIPGWASSMTASLRELSQLVKAMKEEMADEQQ